MFKKLSLFLHISFFTMSSYAVPVTWTLDGVIFDDGAIATGSIVFDADAFAVNDWMNIVLDWNINISGGDESTFPSFSFNPTTVPTAPSVFDTGTGYSFQFWADSAYSLTGPLPDGTIQTRERILVLTSDVYLTNSGGIVPLYTTLEPDTWQSRECYHCIPYRPVNIGSFSAVPVPAAIWLFSSGLIGLIGMARRTRND